MGSFIGKICPKKLQSDCCEDSNCSLTCCIVVKKSKIDDLNKVTKTSINKHKHHNKKLKPSVKQKSKDDLDIR